jgi:Uma2 family endonuclease
MVDSLCIENSALEAVRVQIVSVVVTPTTEEPLDGQGVQTRKWTREEYYRAATQGIFAPDERLELIDGEIIHKVSPQNHPHFTAIMRGSKTLERLFGPRFHVRPQGPLIVSDESEPEPDLAVIKGAHEDYSDHPTAADAALVIEIAESTLRFDLGGKAALYAGAGIQDYWVEDLNDRSVIVHRDPVPIQGDRHGFGYRSVVKYTEHEVIMPLALPDLPIAVVDLLPPRPKQ